MVFIPSCLSCVRLSLHRPGYQGFVPPAAVVMQNSDWAHLGQVSLEKEIFISMEFSWLNNNLIGYSLQ